VLRRIVDGDKDPAFTRVGEVMTRRLVTITPETHVEEAMDLMTQRRFRHLPVIDSGDLVGMLSIGDLMRWITLHQEDEIRLMTAYIVGRA
jgi:CBS domain-containing protein